MSEVKNISLYLDRRIKNDEQQEQGVTLDCKVVELK